MFNYFFYTSRFFMLSISLHLLLLLCGLFFLRSTHTPNVIGEETVILQSYIYNEKKLAHTAPISPPASKKELEKTLEKKALALSPKKTELKPAQTNDMPPAPTTMAASQKSGDERNALLTLLHTAIQREQQYPASAKILEREGRVTIKFNLYQTGNVSGVRVAQSSGTYSLDEAALTAVLKASPFKGVAPYVTSTEEYSVDVIFEA